MGEPPDPVVTRTQGGLDRLADQIEAAEPSPKPILVVDDSDVNRLLALRQLRVLGYQASAVDSGAEAIERVSAVRYALILMDCRMPEMDGLEATRAIREMEGDGPHAPIVAMTANATDRDRELCTAAGMDDYITKPVSRDALREVVARWIRDREGRPNESKRAQVEPDAITGATIEPVVMLRFRNELGEKAFARFVDLYLAEMIGRETDIRSAADRGAGDALTIAAHTLRSTSAALGAVTLAALCAEIESAAQEGAFGLAVERSSLVAAECERVRRALARERSAGA